MCLALPAEIVSIDGEDAVADVDGVQVPISIAFVPDAMPGDYVIVHVGYALSKIDQAEAAQQIAAMHSPAITQGVAP
ncbi:MAG: HypC/HybG/HupF family hydrogenase formation chaperone [Pseudomonadota bacterium]